MSSVGSDQDIQAAKIEPLASGQKYNKQAPKDEGGVIGTDEDVDQARINPGGGRGQYRNPAPHADTQGVAGEDNAIAGAKIDPIASETVSNQNQKMNSGLGDEAVDAARVEPLGSVREQM